MKCLLPTSRSGRRSCLSRYICCHIIRYPRFTQLLLQNLEQGHLVNGSVGSIVGFSTSADAMKLGTQIGRMNPEQTTPVANDPKILGLPEGRVWPMVRFTNGRTILCIPHEFTVNNSYGGMEARRDQVRVVPLIVHIQYADIQPRSLLFSHGH